MSKYVRTWSGCTSILVYNYTHCALSGRGGKIVKRCVVSCRGGVIVKRCITMYSLCAFWWRRYTQFHRLQSPLGITCHVEFGVGELVIVWEWGLHRVWLEWRVCASSRDTCWCKSWVTNGPSIHYPLPTALFTTHCTIHNHPVYYTIP